MECKIINPITYSGWDELLLSHQDYSFFHTSYWARVLCESYNYKPVYFALVEGGKLLVSIPLMDIKSFLTGQRGVSLPFSDYCNPIVSKDIHFQDMLSYLIEYGRQTNWKFIEIRDGSISHQGIPYSACYFGHTLNTSQNEEQIFSSFRSSTKRNIKKAIKEGMKVSINNSLESIKEFYRLNCLTRREHGLPPQPYYFFKNLYRNVISKKLGYVVITSLKNINIAGAIFLHVGRKAIYKYGASDKKYQHLRPNYLVMWEAIKWYSKNGYKILCFGRTGVDNRGLRQFKAGWGTEERIIKYYRYDLKNESFVSLGKGERIRWLSNRVINNIPIPVLKICGALLYKHIG